MTTGLRLGTCKIQKGRNKPTKDWLEDEVMILYAGMVAESGFTKQYCEIGAAQDLREVNVNWNGLSNGCSTRRNIRLMTKRI